MKGSSVRRVWLSGVVGLTLLALRASAGEVATGDSPTPPQPTQVGGAQKAARQQQATSVSAATVLKMAAAGVSAEVIKSFIENASSVQEPSPADLIRLKEHGMSDDLTMALIKRSATTRAPSGGNAAAVSAFLGQVRAQNGGYNGRLDPESYQYFQYYYLYPRTLFSAYDQLGYYRPPWWR